MGLEKMGLPPKPSEKGKDWTPDAPNCEGCQAAFTWINRKHHCRRCGGLFCNNCTPGRVYLRGQGDAPARVCEPCKQIEEAAKFERLSRAKAPRGGAKASSKDDVADTLKHILKPEGRSGGDELDLERILAGVAESDDDDHEVASPSEETAPVSPTRLHEEAQEEKKRYTALKKQGKDGEALKAFKRAKELERQAEAREKEIRHQRKVSTAALAGQHSKTSPSKEDHHGFPDAGLSRRRLELDETQKKRRTPSQDLGKEKAEKDDFLQELKALGWSDKEIREAEKKPVVKSEEQLLAELAAEVRAKSEKAATIAAPGPTDAMSRQIAAHKRQALALKREGKLAEAKDELRKAKILEKQAEEMALLGPGEDEASDDDEIQALIRKLEREEKVKGNAGKGGTSQSIPEDFGFDISFVGDDEDAHVEVDDDDLDDPDMAAALKAMGWEEDAAGASKPQPKASKPTGPALKEQILARKKKALALKREGKIAEARAELAEAKKLEQRLESQNTAPAIAKVPEPVFDEKIEEAGEKIEEAEEKVEVTDEDMRDPEMMAALRAMGFGDDEPAHEAVVTKPNPVDESSLKQEILGIKRQALALKREGRVGEARDTLRRAKVLEQQLEDLQAVSQSQEKTPALIKESRELRRGAQALPALSGVLNFGDDAEEEDVEVDNADLVDPDIAAALAAMGWLDDPSDKLPVAVPKIEEPSPLADVVSDPVPVNLVVQPQIVEFEKVEVKEIAAKEPEPIPSAATANHVVSTKTKSQLQQELLGRKRRALALKREGKSEEARIELQEAKIIEQQIADLDKGLAVTPPAVAESKPVAAQPPPQQAFGNLLKQAPEPSRPVYLDDLPVDEVKVTEDDMQDKALLADLARVGWQEDRKEVAGPAKPTPVPERPPPDVQPVTPNLQQEILALKRKAVALKREGKAGEAREELRKAKLLERQLEAQAGVLSTSATTTAGRSSAKVEGVTPSRPEPPVPVKTSPQATKSPGHKEEMQKQVRQTKDRMKLQQESLAHKRKAMNLRREGKPDEADAEYELAKALEKQMENLDPMHGKEDLGDVAGVDELLDPQLMAALKGLGFGEGDLATATKGPARPPHVGSSSRGSNVEAEKKQLEEQIKAQKVQAVQLKRAGKQAEALDKLRGAKQLEKRLLALSS